MRAADTVTDLLALWVLSAVAVGLALPDPLTVLRPLTLPVLAVMVGAMGLTLSVEAFREVRPAALARILALHLAVVLVAYAAARLVGLGPAATLGFVVLGAVTPELTSPVMTHLAGGDTALATAVLVVAGLASVVTVPGWSALLVGAAVPFFDPLAMLAPLLLAVVVPVGLALAVRHRFPRAVARHERTYPAVSALMVVVVMALVAAANADVVLGAPAALGPVVAAALALLAAGLALGWVGSRGLGPGERRASLMSVGMRDFAVAAGVVLAAGLPAEAALPAVVFGVAEMVAAAGLARWLARRRGGAADPDRYGRP